MADQSNVIDTAAALHNRFKGLLKIELHVSFENLIFMLGNYTVIMDICTHNAH